METSMEFYPSSLNIDYRIGSLTLQDVESLLKTIENLRVTPKYGK